MNLLYDLKILMYNQGLLFFGNLNHLFFLFGLMKLYLFGGLILIRLIEMIFNIDLDDHQHDTKLCIIVGCYSIVWICMFFDVDGIL